MNASESTSKRSGPRTSKSSPPSIRPDPSSEELADRDLAQVLDRGSRRARGATACAGAAASGARGRAPAAPAGPPDGLLHGYRDRRSCCWRRKVSPRPLIRSLWKILSGSRDQRHLDEDVVELGAPVELPVGALDRDVVQHHGARKPAPGAAPGDAELFRLAVDDPVRRRAREKPVGGAQVRAVPEEDGDAEGDQDAPPPTPCRLAISLTQYTRPLRA